MKKSKFELTEAEWEIIRAVWQLEPCAAPSVKEMLEERKHWTYSTVKTLMDRMVAKGLLETERIRNLMLYRSLVTRPEAQKGEMMRAMKRAFDGAMNPMMEFLIESGELGETDLKELEGMIRRRRRKGKKS